ncbi:MAG: DUF2752 domain-containing protein [Bryobacteraceae bacterium]
MRRAFTAVLLFGVLWGVHLPDGPGVPVCGFHWLTGRLCPLCGLTHALFALAKGHVAEAVACNALSPLAFVMLFSLFWSSPFRGRLWSAGTGAFAIYGLFRVIGA